MLHGKTSLITGGTSGIGFATARLFLKNSARVAITGRDCDRLDQARRASDASSYMLGTEIVVDGGRAEL